MAALKRAYADIILNTVKEPAARILASERKALRLQQSLFAAKEEALATILRLKSLMDSQVLRLWLLTQNLSFLVAGGTVIVWAFDLSKF